jgi:hypothetical protein
VDRAAAVEELPDLKYPTYFNDLDKARLQSFTGPLQAVALDAAALKDVKPEQRAEVAILKSTSLARARAVGRRLDGDA